MMSGRTVSHYTILEKLGGGGMGIVYKAEDTRLKRTVALKFLPNELTRDPEAKERFVREAQAASALQHDNICTIHDIDEGPGGELFIVMDFYDGESLKEKIERGPLPLSEAIDIAIQVSRGLAKAHGAGMVHRDIKPANIVLTREGEAKIVDFGLAKLAGQKRLTKTGSTMGTVFYMSPEQANGEAVDQRTDIWSLGATLYEMVAGHSPFRGEYDNAVLYSIVSEPQRPLTAVRSDVPLDLETVVQKALAKDPRERYQHVDDLLVDLRRLQGESASRPTRAAVGGSGQQKRSLARRIAVAGGVIGLAALALLVVVPALQDQMLASNPIPVAVVTFENQTGDSAYDYLREAIPNLLITNLEQSRYLRVATWQRLRDLLNQMGRGQERTIGSELGMELCRRGGINIIVIGTFTKAGEMFATDVKVLDVDTKELLTSVNSKGRGVESILETQIDELSREIAKGAGLSERSVQTASLTVASYTTHSLDAYNFYLRGREDYHRFYYQEAKRFLEKAIALDSMFAEAHAFLSFTLSSLNEGDAADEEIRKAMLYSSRAGERTRLKIEAAYAKNVEKDRATAIRLLREVITKYPDEKESHMFLGIAYRAEGAPELDVVEQLKALELDPDYAAALNELGYAYAVLGQYDKALECFQRQISAHPGDANPMDSMAELYFKLGNLDEAIARYRDVLEIKPDFYNSNLSLSYTLALRGDFDEALRFVNTFIQSVPSAGLKAEGHWDRAFYLRFFGRYGEALQDVEQTQAFARTSGDQRWVERGGQLRGWMLFEQGDYDQSRRVLERWFAFEVEDSPQLSVEIMVQRECALAWLDLCQERLQSARDRLSVIDTLLPSVEGGRGARRLFERNILYAEILIAQDSAAKAIQVCNDAGVPVTPGFFSQSMVSYNLPAIRDTRARAYLKAGERDLAVAEYERIVKFDSSSGDHRLAWPKDRLALARLYEETGNSAKAREQYARFLEAWKNADKGLPEVIEARRRLKNLGQ